MTTTHHFDPDWYRQRYSDVAASGMDPLRHYREHGQAEGRLPHSIPALELAIPLWHGFSQYAVPRLIDLYRQVPDQKDAVNQAERHTTAWVLADWYAAQADWVQALPYVTSLLSSASSLPTWLPQPDIILTGVEIHLRLQQPDRAAVLLERTTQSLRQDPPSAQDSLATTLQTPHSKRPSTLQENLATGQHSTAKAQDRFPPPTTPTTLTHLANLRLAHANLALARNQPEYALQNLNAIFNAGGLQPIARRNPDHPLNLDNLAGDTTIHPIPPGHLSGKPAQQHRVNVLMPAHNAAAYIATAIRSVQEQTWSNLELWVIDDASTDATAHIVQTLASADPRIHYLRLAENQGSYQARNMALAMATGDYITIHDSDDWSHPQRLEFLIHALRNHPQAVAVLGHWVRCSTNLHFHRWRLQSGLLEPSVSTLLWHREVGDTLGGWDHARAGADSEHLARIQRYYGPDAVITLAPHIPLVFARQRCDSHTQHPDTHLRSDYFGLRRNYREAWQAWHQHAQPHQLHIPLPQQPVASFTPDHAASLTVIPAITSPSLPSNPPRKTPTHPFPLPLKNHPPCAAPGPKPHFNITLYADCSTPTMQGILQNLMDWLATQSTPTLAAETEARMPRLGILHWPTPEHADAPIHPQVFFSTAAINVTWLTAADFACSDELWLLPPSASLIPLDQWPQLRFQRLRHFSTPQAVQDWLQQIASTHTVAMQSTLSNTSEPSSLTPAALQTSGLWDPEWYCSQYPDILAAQVDPHQHFLDHGWHEGRLPGPDFNPASYAWRYPDVHPATPQHTLKHYLRYGQPRGLLATPLDLRGCTPGYPDAPNLLLCGHAAGHTLLGAERSLLDLLAAYQMLGLRVVVTLPDAGNTDYLQHILQRCARLVVIPYAHWNAIAPPNARIIDQLQTLMRTESISAVHVNTLMLREPLLAARHLGLKTLLHLHEAFAQDPDLCQAIGLSPAAIQAQLHPLADYILANSHFLAQHWDDLAATNPGPRPRVAIVPNTVDFAALDLPLPTTNERIRIGLISSNTRKKGIADARTIAQHLAHTTPQAEILLIGPEHPELKQILQNAPSNLRWTGHAPTPAAAMQELHIVLNLSHFAESFGLTVLEAMAAGRPVVAYNHGAIPELIRDGIDGYLLPLGDTTAVAQRLHTLCTQPDRITRMGAAAQQRAWQTFSPDRQTQALAAVLTQVGIHVKPGS